MITLDFETEAIVGNPLVHPPKPVGLAVQVDNHEPYYVTDWQDMYDRLSYAYSSNELLLFHNAPFDTRVAEEHFGLPIPAWERIHDTVYMLYLADPYAASLGLKSSAERWLNEPPEEQDVLKQWILANVPESKPSDFGAFICRAPVDIVGPYAKGDVHRTFGLFTHLRPLIPTEAYDRERRLMPILVRSSQRGVRISREALGEAIELYTGALGRADDQLRVLLGVPALNPASGFELGAALQSGGYLGANPILTATGRIKVAKGALEAQITDHDVLNLIRYRQTLETCLGSHMRPWYAMSEEDGRVHAEWNQVRSTEGYKRGARTGRLSCEKPNLMNVPSVFDFDIPDGFPKMPILRTVFLPEEGHVWLKRDFSGQEIRIAAHFEGAALMQAFIDNPNLDPHEMARVKILEITGKDFTRRQVKITAFQIIYGGGGPAISSQVGCTLEEAYALRDAYLTAMPGIKQLQKLTKRRGHAGQPVRTWGGREFYTEPPKNGRSFEYKLLNYLIQGSAADQTKQCINDWDDKRGKDDTFVITVHDEVNISVPKETLWQSMQILKSSMDQDLFDVPMRSEGFIGDNWGEMGSSADYTRKEGGMDRGFSEGDDVHDS